MRDRISPEEQEDLIKERFSLVSERVASIHENPEVAETWLIYFHKEAGFLEQLQRIYEMQQMGCLKHRSLQQCMEDQEFFYRDIRPENYEESYLNPEYAAEQLGEKAGRMLCLLACELRSGIGAAFEGRLEELVILMELFVQVYNCFCMGEEPDLQEANQSIYWHFYDYSLLQTERQVHDMVVPDDNFFTKIIMESDLSDIRYLYLSGLPVGENEIRIARYLNALSEEEIQSMADTFTEGYRIGFAVTGKDIKKKKTVGLNYALGFERMMRAAIRNFEKMGLRPTIAREPSSTAMGIGNKRSAYSTSVNRQYEFDHKEDRAFYFDKAYIEHRLDMLKKAFEKYKKEAAVYGGPAVQEVFGEAPYSPVRKESAIRYRSSQQELVVYNMAQAGQITNQYIPGEERSFTIIAYPVPEIGKDFEAIFAKTVELNTLDYQKYQKMQQCLIDVLDTAKEVHITGRGGNQTDLTVAVWQLEDPAHQTAFENCVADVNIPVGEVFTSPVLEGTNGVLHVSRVFLNGLPYRDLKLTFTEGMVTDYSCGNYEDPKKGKEYIRNNLLMHHETLPMGEFAIGTNTTAYRMGKDFAIEDRLPILIAEKTGPHFAVGDTCYSHDEDTSTFNPDGKEIMARDNSCTLIRKEDPQKAYFNCHTDITIPFDELGAITVIRPDGSSTDLIRDGRFVVPGTEELNIPLEQ